MNITLKLPAGASAAALSALALAAPVAHAAPSPSVTTGHASNIHQFSAALNGIVRPNGAPTSYQFEWGLTTSYGVLTSSRPAGHGTKPVAVHAGIFQLLPGTTYHYRLMARSTFGGTLGRDRTFKTAGPPPAVVGTGPAIQPGTSSVTLTGEINPNHVDTTWYFRYGLTPAYGLLTGPQTIPATSGPAVVTSALQGLQSGTVFHYQLVAVNRGMPRVGADATFMTYPDPAPVPKLSVRTKPKRDRHRPYVFTTSGSISGPLSIPSQFACAGTVTIRYFLHHHQVQRAFAPVGPDCTFSGQIVLGRKPGRHPGPQVKLRVLSFYSGDGYLTKAKARVGHVTVG